MANLQGKELVLELRAAGVGSFKFVVCETDSSFSGTTNTNSTSSKCDGGTPQIGLGTSDYTIDFNGVIRVDPNLTTQLTYQQMLVWWKKQQLLDFRRNNSGVVQQEGQGYITAIGDSAPTDDLVSFSFTLTGVGELQVYGDGES
ncbi:MAG: phage tail tube protein [Agriterribacter sp.]